MAIIRVTISIVVAIIQYFKSSLYKAAHFTSMILTLICIFQWISIATQDDFELNELGNDENLFYTINSVINKLIEYRNVISVNIL